MNLSNITVNKQSSIRIAAKAAPEVQVELKL